MAPRKKKPEKHLLDKRAQDLVGKPIPDGMMTTAMAANWLHVSTQWLEIARHHGFGPKFVRYSARCVRYSPDALKRWVEERTFAHTKQYTKG